MPALRLECRGRWEWRTWISDLTTLLTRAVRSDTADFGVLEWSSKSALAIVGTSKLVFLERESGRLLSEFTLPEPRSSGMALFEMILVDDVMVMVTATRVLWFRNPMKIACEWTVPGYVMAVERTLSSGPLLSVFISDDDPRSYRIPIEEEGPVLDRSRWLPSR